MLADVDEVPGRDVRYPYRRRRFDLPAPRERDCAVGGADGQAVCEVLGSCAVSAGGRREDGQERGEFLYRARPSAAGTQAVVDSVSADVGAAPQAVELHV